MNDIHSSKVFINLNESFLKIKYSVIENLTDLFIKTPIIFIYFLNSIFYSYKITNLKREECYFMKGSEEMSFPQISREVNVIYPYK